MNQDNDPTNDKPVNEEDFGDHNVDFYDEYEDGNGNLEDYVEEITTDPTGDQTGEPLPDPEETGRAFDAQAEDYYIPTEIVVEEPNYSPEVSDAQTASTESSEEFWVEYNTPTESYTVEATSGAEDYSSDYDASVESYSSEASTTDYYSESSEGEEFWVEYDIPSYEAAVEETYSGSVETYEGPVETYSAPAYTEETSVESYYSEPVDTYEAPVESYYSEPVVSYEAPAETYSEPAVSYEAPVETYSEPAVSYEAPVETYSEPVYSYEAPVESYSNSDAVEIYVEAMANQPEEDFEEFTK